MGAIIVNIETIYRNQGDILFLQERYDEVLEICEILLQRNLKDADLFVTKSLILSRLNRHHEALKACEQALRLDSKNPRGYHRLCYILFGLGKIEEAQIAYKKAASIGLNTSAVSAGETIW